MKKLVIALAAVLAVFVPSILWATDTVTVTQTNVTLPAPSQKGIKKITFTFSSDDGEVARAASTAAANVTGYIVKFHYIPDGVNTPDAAADIRAYSALTGGIDLLYAACDNVGATETVDFPANTTYYRPPFLAGETLYFYAGSLGAGTNAGIMYVWILSP